MSGKHSETSVFVGNLSEKVTEELLHELFLQAGPVVKVNIPKQRSFGFVEFKHKCSVSYAVRLMDGVPLFGKRLKPALPKGMSEPMDMPLTSYRFPRSQSSFEHRSGDFPSAPADFTTPPNFPQSYEVFHSAPPPAMHRPPVRDLRDKMKPRQPDYMQPSKSSKRNKGSSSFHPSNDMNAIPDFLSFDPLYSSQSQKSNDRFNDYWNDEEEGPYHGGRRSNYRNQGPRFSAKGSHGNPSKSGGKVKHGKYSHSSHSSTGHSRNRNGYW